MTSLLWNDTHQNARVKLAECGGIFKALAGHFSEGALRDLMLSKEAEIDNFLQSTRDGGAEPKRVPGE